jgi:hypothetical protein
MKVIWEVEDIKPGRIVWDKFDSASQRMIVVSNNCDGQGDWYGIVRLSTGAMFKIGSGSKEAVVTHMNNNSLVPKEEDK